MSARCSLVVNGQPMRVSPGDTSLEAALADGVIAPMQGIGSMQGAGPSAAPAARRSQSRRRRGEAVPLPIPSAVPEVPPPAPRTRAEARPVQKRVGTVSEIKALGAHTTQVVVTLTKRLPHEPGDQVEVTFEGHAPLTLAPTLGVEGGAELNELVFHMRGAIPAALADGQAVKVRGPVGLGAYRPGGGRLVLVSGETGFAAIWAIARAARYVEPAREITLVVGARDPLDLYMRPALEWLRATGVARIVMAADRHRQRPPDVRPGPLTAHVPTLRATDIVHASGCPSTMGAVEVLAAAAGARFFPIPLDPEA